MQKKSQKDILYMKDTWYFCTLSDSYVKYWDPIKMNAKHKSG